MASGLFSGRRYEPNTKPGVKLEKNEIKEKQDKIHIKKSGKATYRPDEAKKLAKSAFVIFLAASKGTPGVANY